MRKLTHYLISITIATMGIGTSYAMTAPWERGDTTGMTDLLPVVEVVEVVEWEPDSVNEFQYAMPYRTVDGEFNRLFRLKMNAAGWLLLISNVEGEIDLSPGWSFTLPIYYGAMNYFSSTVKFRMFGFRPEVRRWFRADNTEWFVGMHFGIGGFNFAFGGDYRYQSDWRKKPAVGGGVSGGYRLPLSSDRRWEVEFAIGLGVYSAPYNQFKNEKNARPIDSVKKIYFGPDNISISFSYAFDVKSGKGGEK